MAEAADRLLIVDLGDLRTRAAAFRGPGLEPGGTLEVESAVAPLDAGGGGGYLATGGGSFLPAYSGIGTTEAGDPLPPILDPAHAEAGGGGALAVGAAASDLAGYPALVAAGVEAHKLDAILRSLLFALCEPGERVDLLLVADPGAKADRLRDVECAWLERPDVAVTVLDPTDAGGAAETRTFRVAPRVLDAGAALFETAFERGILEPDGPPALLLDGGHRATRAYLVDPGQGILDLEIVPHGGASYLEHARRIAAEARDRGRDVSLLRQLASGTDMLTFGATTRLTRRFFEEARRELSKAVAQSVAGRLRRHLERGGRWPAGLLLAGGLALPDGAEIVSELRARGCAFQRVRTLPRSPSALIEGALAAERRAWACA